MRCEIRLDTISAENPKRNEKGDEPRGKFRSLIPALNGERLTRNDYNHSMQSTSDSPIGTLNEGSLHAALKDYVYQSGNHRQQDYLALLAETLQQAFTTSALRKMGLSERVGTQNRCHLFAIVQN